MKTKRLKLGGIGVFHDDVEVPIEALGDAPLVAVVGDNGAGKSTLLGCIPGSLWRVSPGRGAVAGLAHRKDSFIEHVVEVAGVELTARVLIDGMARGKPTEAYLFEGAKPITDGKARSFDAAVADRFGPLSVYLASAFAAQTREGRFLDLPVAGRKELFARLLGLGHLQELSIAAGERARAAELRRTELQARSETLRARAEGLGEALMSLEVGESDLAAITSRRAAAEARAEVAAAELAQWHEVATRLGEAFSVANTEHAKAKGRRDGLELRMGDAKKRVASATAERAGLLARLERRAELEAEVRELQSARARLDEAEAKLRALRQTFETEADARERAMAKRNAWLMTLTTMTREADQAEADLRAAEAAASGLGAVPCGGQGDFGSCNLISKATRARDSLPHLRDRAEKARAAVRDHGAEPSVPAPPDRGPIRDAESLCRQLAGASTRLGEVEKALASLEQVQERLTTLDADLDSQMAEIAALREEHKRAEAALVVAAELAKRASIAVKEHASQKPTAPNSAELAQIRGDENRATGALAKARETAAVAKQAADELEALRTELEASTAELDDWRHLQEALGTKGIQALEIDACGPEVSDLCNELLHSCYGSRFSVSLETTQLKADGKGTKEVFDLRVIDTERGTEGSADQLSGGEQVLVSEALSLAICIYNARRSSVPMLDLIRDECSGALSEGNAAKYVEMLRKAIDLGGFHRCYFVAHQQQLWALADAILEVADGAVRIAGAADVVVSARKESEAA